MKANIRSILLSIRKGRRSKRIVRVIAVVISLLTVGVVTSTPSCATETSDWEKEVSNIVWVAYSPPSANPLARVEAMPEAVREDLRVLRQAKFTGLVTYSSSGVLGRQLPTIAKELGFKGLIMGIWDPSDQNEIDAAKTAISIPIVLGFCVGNGGLGKRYQLPALSAAIQNLHQLTGKPVTTTEEIDDYSDEELLSFGDWVFPNAHPYFHDQLDPKMAVEWTKGAYDELKRRSKRFVMFKEVGLPTKGDPQGKMSEVAQEKYYQELAKTGVRFVYFEAFDQPWKTHLPIEPYWGLFNSDRTPKRFVASRVPLPPPLPPLPGEVFYVYLDADYSENHFEPAGYMGDCGDIEVDKAFEGNPHSGKTCIRIVYTAKGKGPYTCNYSPPCRWAGVYWQEPANNWGKDAVWADRGFNLSKYNRFTFWARANKDCRIEFKVGGINERYGDSLKYPRSKMAKLTTEWKAFEIDLKGADLKHIIGGFCWATNWTDNPEGATFYLDDVRFEKE